MTVSFSRVVSPVTMWGIVASGIAAIISLFPPGRYLIERNIVVYCLLVGGAVYWGYMFFGALWQNRQAARSVVSISKIATDGVYGIVRHPIYSGDIVLAWSLAILFPTPRFVLAAAWLTIVLSFWMRLEESGLVRRFGKEYGDYRRRVPMVVPRFLKNRRASDTVESETDN